MIKRKVTKQDMAKMVGASREMVSRVMKDLETAGYPIETGRRPARRLSAFRRQRMTAQRLHARL